jgi:hypothetical protein
MIEIRVPEVNFKPINDSELRDMIRTAGLEVAEMYGDCAYGSFGEDTSDFMIRKMIKSDA